MSAHTAVNASHFPRVWPKNSIAAQCTRTHPINLSDCFQWEIEAGEKRANLPNNTGSDLYWTQTPFMFRALSDFFFRSFHFVCDAQCVYVKIYSLCFCCRHRFVCEMKSNWKCFKSFCMRFVYYCMCTVPITVLIKLFDVLNKCVSNSCTYWLTHLCQPCSNSLSKLFKVTEVLFKKGDDWFLWAGALCLVLLQSFSNFVLVELKTFFTYFNFNTKSIFFFYINNAFRFDMQQGNLLHAFVCATRVTPVTRWNSRFGLEKEKHFCLVNCLHSHVNGPLCFLFVDSIGNCLVWISHT